MFLTQEECNQKLKETVIFYGNDPVYVSEAKKASSPILKCAYLPIPTTIPAKFVEAPIKDSLFNMKDLGTKLGYVNIEKSGFNEVTYSQRVGIRKVHQGLCKSNVRFSDVMRNEQLGFIGALPEFDRLLNTDKITKTFKNLYPSLPESVSLLSESTKNLAVAFHRQFAIRKNYIGPLYLEYKGKQIGWSEDGTKFKIHEDFQYLLETLNEIPYFKAG